MANAVEQLVKSNQAARAQGQPYTVGQYLPLDQIRMDGGTQARAGLDNATLAEYTESWQALSNRQNGFLDMPLIIVYHDGESYWLADGFHRVVAYRQFLDGGSASASPRAIRAEVRQGTRRDAVLYACGANSTHGLRRTNADKRRAIETILSDDEWKQWSDSEIARRCNVSDKTVATVRADLYPRNSEDSRIVQRGGTTYQQKPPAQKPTIPDQPMLPEMPAPFWQSMSPNHPTAHLWTRTGLNEHHAACGMVTQRVPSGNTEAGHCSACVRATWPQNQAAPAAAQPTISDLAGLSSEEQQQAKKARDLLKGVSAWDESIQPQVIDDARACVRRLRNGAARDALIAEIDQAERAMNASNTPDLPDMPETAAPAELAPITVQTNQGPRPVAPTRVSGTLAWHTSLTEGGRYAITHIPSGRRIAQFMYEGRVDRAFDQLCALDWAQVAPDGGMQPPMAVQVARVLVQFDDVDQYAARQTRLAALEAEIAALAPESASDPVEMDDAAMQATIRAKAHALGLELLWENGQVLLYWTDEDLDTVQPMSYPRAREWLATEAPGLAEHRQQIAEIRQAHAVRRLTPGAHAQAISLLVTIRTALITEHIDRAETQARELLAIIASGEATD